MLLPLLGVDELSLLTTCWFDILAGGYYIV